MRQERPSTRVLVTAAVVVTLTGPPIALGAPSEGGDSTDGSNESGNPAGQDDADGMPTPGTRIADGTIRVWARGIGADRGEAEATARRAAFDRLVKETSAWIPDWSDSRIRKVLELPTELKTVARREAVGTQQVEVAVELTVLKPAYDNLLNRCRSVWVDSVHLSTCVPDVLTVVETALPMSDVSLRSGDILLGFADGDRERLDPSSIDGMGSGAATLLAARVLRVDRDGSEREVRITSVKAVPPVPDRAEAPTCGPCCHGHCADEMLPKRFDQ